MRDILKELEETYQNDGSETYLAKMESAYLYAIGETFTDEENHTFWTEIGRLRIGIVNAGPEVKDGQ